MRLAEALLFCAVFSLSATAGDLAERAAKRSSRDVKVPRALVAKIEKDYRAFLEKQQFVINDGIKRKLIHIKVELTQKKDAALHENVSIATPLGGGVIDLADFVTPLRGAFNLKILARGDDNSEFSDLKVYFVSLAKQRMIEREEFGAGCGKYMEITSFFNEKMGASGFELFSAERRYASVIGGTFVFVAFDPEALHVGSVSFHDSRYPQLYCE